MGSHFNRDEGREGKLDSQKLLQCHFSLKLTVLTTPGVFPHIFLNNSCVLFGYFSCDNWNDGALLFIPNPIASKHCTIDNVKRIPPTCTIIS